MFDATAFKPCPFCGSEPVAKEHKVPQLVADVDEPPAIVYAVQCHSCAIYMTSRDDAELLARWNRRDGDRCAAGCALKAAIRTFTGSLET